MEHGFWFDEATTMLVGTVDYHIGKDQIQNAYIQLEPEKIVLKDKNVTKNILGVFPTHREDIVQYTLIWE